MRLMQTNPLRSTWTLLAGIAVLLFSGPVLSQIAPSPASQVIQRSAGPDEFYFYEEDDRKTVVDFKKDHIVRICVSESRHPVPMIAYYDSKMSAIQPGDCMRVEAKKVELEPAEQLEENWALHAEVDTVS